MELLNKLQPNPKNPRYIEKEEFERLKKKIQSFPEMLEKRPIVYDENFIVLGGNQRLRVLQALAQEGFEMKESYFLSCEGWTEEQKRNFVINDNISDGKWDMDLLANEWSDLPLGEWGINIQGWVDENPSEKELWEGMPEFDGVPDFKSYKRIIVHFENENDYQEFAKLINQKLTKETRYIYFPKKDKEELKKFKIVTEK